MRNARFAILFVLLLAGAAAFGQSRIRTRYLPQEAPDSVDLEYYRKPKFWQATAMVAGINVGTWAYDRYIQKAPYTHLSYNSVKRNLTTGFIWDNDFLSTNMFLHPYHGNLYFTSARASGFNYWRSGLFAFAGSAMWETVMETEYPSTNDIIATPIGGMALGEVAFRTSDLILNDRTVGWERFGREAGAFIVSPMRGLVRIINGDAWRRRATTGRQFGLPPIIVEVSLGARGIGYRGVPDFPVGMAAELNVTYGMRFVESSNTPFDYFTFRAHLNAISNQPVLSQINIIGRLMSREVLENKSHHLSVGAYQHFDFYDSDTISKAYGKTPYKLGTPASAGVGVFYRGDESKPWVLDAHVHANAVLLGGILTDHYYFKDRNYNLASGFAVKSGVNVNYGVDKFSASVDFDIYRLFTWGYSRGTDLRKVNYKTLDAMGDDSAATFAMTDIRVDYGLTRHLLLTAGFTHYYRSTHYRDFPNVRATAYSARLLLTYKF